MLPSPAAVSRHWTLLPQQMLNASTERGDIFMPGLVDVHTHGRIGFDFDSADEKQMQKMYRSYVSDGTTTVIPTIASAPFSQMLQALERIRACGCFPAAHLEGRYLSPKRRGAHRVDLLADPDIDELHTLLEHIAPLPLHITLAPELPGANEFIREALRLGVTVGVAPFRCNVRTGTDCLCKRYRRRDTLVQRDGAAASPCPRQHMCGVV